MGVFESNLKISRTDPNFKREGEYNILVVKQNQDSETPHLFSIKYSTGSFHTNIVEGLPEIGNQTRGDISFYSYHVINLTGSITVTVTPISGDPDLFISINSSNRFPSSNENDYFSVAIGADSIKLNLTEFHQMNPRCTLAQHTNSRCSLFIAVKCVSEECGYILQVARTDEIVLRLIDGYPQYGSVQLGEPQYFMFIPSLHNESTIISAFSKTGKVVVYAALQSSDNMNRVEFPTAAKHDFQSSQRVNYQIIQINDRRMQQCGRLCKIYIGVYLDTTDASVGAFNKSQYTIVATNGMRQLIDGQTVVDRIAEKVYKYYVFRVPCTDCVLSISLAPLSGGDPDLYVNHAMFRLPTVDKADFQATSYRGDFLQISPQDELIRNNPRGMRGPYVIGVFGSKNCTYSLTVTTSASVLQEMSQNIPVRQEQLRNTIKNFVFYSWKKANIKISLSMHSGRATIRANVVPNVHDINVLDNLPSSESACLWSSLRLNTVNYLTISKEDSKFLENGVYFIAIESEEDCNYDISVQYISEEDYVFVRLAEANRVHLLADEVKRFAFVISSNENINVHVTTYFGQIEGLVYSEVNKTHPWKIPPSGTLLIKSISKRFVLGTYYVTLKAIQESDVIFVVEQGVKMIWLSEGLIQKGAIQRNSFAYFFYSIPKVKISGQTELRFNALVTMHDNTVIPKMYIKHITRQHSNLPNDIDYDYAATWDNDLQQLAVSLKLNSTINETLAIAVSGTFKNNTSAQSVVISVMAWSNGIVLMYPGYQYMNKFANPNEIHTYELSLRKAERAYIEVVPCMGEVEFFVTKSLSSITDRKYDIKTTELNKGRLFGILEQPRGTYYVTVRALGYQATESSKKEGILYTIKTKISNETKVADLENYALENYGNIEASLDGLELTLTWGKIYVRGKNNAIVEALYSVYVTDDNNTNMHTICGIKIGGADRIANEISSNSFTYSLHEKSPDKKLYFNVIAVIPSADQSIAYTPMTFQLPRFNLGFGFNTSKFT